MTKITTLKNIGSVMAKKLKAIGIKTKEDFIKENPEKIFIKLRHRLPEINKHSAYYFALRGAKENKPWFKYYKK